MTDSLIAWTGLAAPVLAYIAGVVFLAALVRGYSGFGFSALVVTAVSMVVAPSVVVPLVLLLEIAASIHMLPSIRRHVDWRLMGWLMLAAGLAMPFGTWFLATLPETAMRAAISLAVLVFSLLIWRWRGPALRAGAATVVPAGIVSGALNGAAAIGGLPLVLYFLSTRTAAATTRAMVIAYLLFADIYASGIAALHGLLGARTIALAAVMLVPLILGNALGNRRFLETAPESFRRFALLLLISLSAAGLVRVVLGR